MSYDIYIGELKLEEYKDEVEDNEGEYTCSYTVDSMNNKDAPNFYGDDMTGNSNHRHPGYSQWSDFCRRNNLYELFFKEYVGIMSRHPGCFRLTKEHLKIFKDTLKYREKIDERPAGLDQRYIKDSFVHVKEGEETTDYDKVRLIWLIYWTEWALKNCKYPAIANH